MNMEDEIFDLNQFKKAQEQQSSKYKVSNMNQIQSIKNQGDIKKLEESYNNRQMKTGIDFNFKTALLSHERKANKQLHTTVNRFN